MNLMASNIRWRWARPQFGLVTLIVAVFVASAVIGLNMYALRDGPLISRGWPAPVQVIASATGEEFWNVDAVVIDTVIALVCIVVTWATCRCLYDKATPKQPLLAMLVIGGMVCYLLLNLVPYNVRCLGHKISASGNWPTIGLPFAYYQYIHFEGMRYDCVELSPFVWNTGIWLLGLLCALVVWWLRQMRKDSNDVRRACSGPAR
jgi:hypothetical protein